MWITSLLDMDKADAVDSERRMWSNIIADAWAVDRLCEGGGVSLV